jgi:hypothetical protein
MTLHHLLRDILATSRLSSWGLMAAGGLCIILALIPTSWIVKAVTTYPEPHRHGQRGLMAMFEQPLPSRERNWHSHLRETHEVVLGLPSHIGTIGRCKEATALKNPSLLY